MKKKTFFRHSNLIVNIILIMLISCSASGNKNDQEKIEPKPEIAFYIFVQTGVKLHLKDKEFPSSDKPYELAIETTRENGRLYFIEPLNNQKVSLLAKDLESITMHASGHGLSIIANYGSIISDASRCCVNCPQTGTSAYGLKVWLECYDYEICCQ